jgi:hypothetical protein
MIDVQLCQATPISYNYYIFYKIKKTFTKGAYNPLTPPGYAADDRNH